MAIRLHSYFERIRVPFVGKLSLELLQKMQLGHLMSITFEGMDPFLGRPVSISQEAIWKKLVTESRGGYCYEQNGLLLHVLKRMGFQATSALARVLWARRSSDAPRTHQLLVVTIHDAKYLVDVGFGPQNPSAPLEFTFDKEQITPHGTFGIVREQSGFEVQTLQSNNWLKLYDFTIEQPQHADIEMANWFMSTHPLTLSRRNLVISRFFPDRRLSLMNKVLTTSLDIGDLLDRLIKTPAEFRSCREQELLVRAPIDTDEIWTLLPEEAIPAWP